MNKEIKHSRLSKNLRKIRINSIHPLKFSLLLSLYVSDTETCIELTFVLEISLKNFGNIGTKMV